MAYNHQNQENNPRKFSPLIIIAAVVVAIVILLIVWLATRPSKPVAPVATVTPVEVSASPAAVATPAPTVAAEWTKSSLEQTIADNTPLHFAKDSTRLLAGEEAKVETIAAALRHYKNIQLRFRGHTADFNLKKFQYELSVLRASKIRWMLEYRAGDDITSVTVQGLGSKEPISKGNSEAQRAPNRRVEIILQNAEPK